MVCWIQDFLVSSHTHVNEDSETAITVTNREKKTKNLARTNARRLRWISLLVLVAGLSLYVGRRKLICPLLRKVAESRIKSHQIADARWWIDCAAGIAPQDPSTLLLQARILRHQGDMAGVSNVLKQAREHGARDLDLRRQQWLAMAQSGQMSLAEPHLSRLLTDQSYDNKDVCLAFVIGYLRTQQSDSATTLLNTWIADTQDDATPYLYRARIRNLLSQPESAEEDFRSAIAVEPDWPQPQLELGELLTDTKKYESAKQLLAGVMDVPELAVRARIAMAECELSLANTTAAVSILAEACSIEPSSVDARIAYGNALVETGDYRSAIDNLKQALESRSNDDEAHYLLGQAYTLDGNGEAATPHFEFVKEARRARDELDKLNSQLITNPKDATSLIRAGEILLMYGTPEEGVIRIMAGLDLAPRNLTGLALLAAHYEQKAVGSSDFQALAVHYKDLLDKARSSTE